jgi:hypothetical protein
MNWRIWMIGVIGGFIAASSNTVTLLIVDPDHFNVSTTGGWKHLGISIVVSGVVGAALYLKQHPTPWDGTTDRRTTP